MKFTNLCRGVVTLALLFFIHSAVPGQANKPAVEYQSLLNMRF
jgi:hypothetical protein